MNDKNRNAAIISVIIAIMSITLFFFIHKDNTGQATIITIKDSHSATSAATENVSTTITSTSAVPSAVSSSPVTTTVPLGEPLYININTATCEEFVQLHGIGEAIAKNIIAYRTENDGFNNIEELMEVSGIGSSVFEDIREFVYVENPVYETAVSSTEPEIIIAVEEPTEPEIEEPSALTLEECAPININTADIEELALLPYVTDDIADEIITLRTEIGGFQHVYELLLIEELSQSQAAEIVEYVTVE